MDATPALDDGAVRWSVPPADRDDRPVLVLLHGYGSDEHDLFGLVPYLPPEFVYAAVRAPLTPPFPAPGFSWYPIEGLDGRSTEKVTEGAARLLEWLDAAGIGRAGLLGFSQGGAVSLQALRLAPDRIPFAVNLSGYVHPGPLPGDPVLAERRDTPVFWGRGAVDEVIPEPLIAHSIQWLPEHVDLSGRVYEGMAHSVSEQELHDVRTFLGRQLDRITAKAAQ
ncbi:alpha/beta hydrolase [Microbacterium sp. GXF7504]